MSDPWAAFPDAPSPATPIAAQAPQADPWAAFPDAPSSAQPGQDQGGAQAAFAHGGLTGIPIVGPLLGKGADYIGSHIGAAISGKPVDQVLAEGQALAAATEAAHPVASTAGGLTTATMALSPVLRAAPALFGVGEGGLTAGKVAAGAGTGAALGGTDAAIRSDGDPTSIAIGAGFGGVGGAAGPVIGAGLGRVGEAIADRVAQGRAMQDINIPFDLAANRRVLAPVQVSRPAAEILTRAGVSDGTLSGQGAANIASAGPDAMLADAGPASQNVLDTALQRGGPGAVAARQAIEQRAAQADQQVSGALDRAFGKPQGLDSAEAAIRNNSAAARGAAYDAAYSSPIDYSAPEGQALEDMVRSRVPGGIIARANSQMRIDGDASRQILANVADDGTVTYQQLPDVRQLDYITRALRDVSQRGDGQGALGGNTSEGRSYGNLARDIRTTLRQAVPEYGNALDTAAEPIGARNALEFGSGVMSPSVSTDSAALAIRDMTQPEVRQARLGLRSTMADTLANVRRTVTDPNIDARQAMDAVKQLSSDAAQQKVAMLIARPEQEALNQALLRATRALELRASVATNSRTAARQMTNETVQRAAAPGPVGKLAMGEPVKAGKAAVQFFTRMSPTDITRREDAIYGELANVLTGPRGADATGLLNRLTQAHQARAATNSFARQIPYGRVASTGLLSLMLGQSDIK
jgi:hypothetical protein